MITYQRETISDCAEELEPLIYKHYEEIAAYQDKIELAPDWDRYLAMEMLNTVKMVTVRDSGKLVGYYICVVVPNLHYKNDLYSVNDIVMILPEYRNAKVGMELFQHVEAWMKELGVSVMSVHMKTSQPFDKLCEGLEWDYMERLYTKCIKE